jgi:hypothetical protein
MMRAVLLGAFCALEAINSWAHPADEPPTFEVASVKLSGRPESTKGFFRVKMDADPAHLTRRGSIIRMYQ